MRLASCALAALLLAGTVHPHAAAQPAAEPTAADLVARNLAARGGSAALAALKSVRLEGKLIFPGGFELTYNEVRSGGATRFEAALQGLALVQAYDGKGGAWRINPFQGRKDAEKMSDDEARSLADSASIAGVLLSAASDGSSTTYLGREDFDGTNCYKLKVAQPDGDEFVYLIDPDSMLEVKIIETRRIRGAVQVSESELGDYEAVGGVMFPMSIESGPQGSSQRQRIIVARGTANADAPATLFAQPTN
ncbi:hypothetical protein [Sandarakinorhabdus sp. AAP62]|uniref:hypothetical protein n=1 Tax=Sandarakinorhabdus sp. AAP62 TaxID=1248916 RepID=UPI0012675039|nr:hypothetical protein [Sandarakinorhabdus sp. AAP62]